MREILITSSVLIVIIALLRTLLKGKISLRLQYALWLLVALRLLIPVSFAGSPVSVMNMVAAVEQVTQQAAPPKAPQMPSVMEPSAGGNVNTGTSPAAPIAPVEPKAPVSAGMIARVAWLAGIGGVAVWFLLSDFLFRRKLRCSRKPLKGMDCPLPVYVTEAAPSPCLYGALRPTIYLTPDCLENENTLRHVLAHEETHYRHLDHIWSLARCVCLAVYWFNPLVWLAAALSRRDCELACDEGAILHLGEVERISYGRTLLSMVVPKSAPADLLRTATTMTSGKNGLRERIALIAKRPKAAVVTVIAVVLIAAVAVGCTFTGAQGSKKPDVPLEEALAVLPDELKDSVVLTAKEDLEEDTLLEAFYKEDYGTQWGGALLLVWRVTPVVFEKNHAWNVGSEAEPLARDADWYYVLYAYSPDEVKDSPEHEAGYRAAQQAALAWVKDIFANQSGLTAIEDDPSYQAINAAVSYPGRHIDVSYKPNYGLEYYPEGQKDETYKLLLSQPVRQGEGGIWCVDHWYYKEGQYLPYTPDAQVPIAEYYAMLQESADKGEETWRLDPLQVSMDFVEYMFEVEGRPAEAFTVGEIYEGEPQIASTAISINEGVENRLGELLSAGAQLAVPDENGVATWENNYPVSDQGGSESSYAARMVEEYTWSDKAEDAYFNGGTLEPEAYDWQMRLYRDGGAEFRFYAGSNIVRYYDLANGTAWYEAVPKEGGKGIAELVRDWFYEEEFLNRADTVIHEEFLNRANTATHAEHLEGFEMMARLYASGVVRGLLNLTPGSPWAVEDAKVYKAEVIETLPEDNTLFCFRMSLALIKEDILNSPYNAGAGTTPMEEFPSAQLWTMEVVMRWENGEWRRVVWGNEGYKLENYQ